MSKTLTFFSKGGDIMSVKKISIEAIIFGVIMVGTIAASTAPLYASPKQQLVKTYSKGEISFAYPGDWVDLSETETQADVPGREYIAHLGRPGVSGFLMHKTPISPERTLQAYFDGYKEHCEERGQIFMSEKKRVIDGNNALQVTMKTQMGTYTTSIFLDKNNMRYSLGLVLYTARQELLNKIISSMKIHSIPSVAVQQTPPLSTKAPNEQAAITLPSKQDEPKNGDIIAGYSEPLRENELIKEGRNLLNSNDFQRAITVFSKAIQSNPQNYLAYRLRGNAYDNLGDRQNAIKDWKVAARIGDKIIQSYLKSLDVNW